VQLPGVKAKIFSEDYDLKEVGITLSFLLIMLITMVIEVD